jgi:hypothetical protein
VSDKSWNPNAVWLSYSGASSFKACPEKFYLSKEWQAKGNFSYFVFGSAVECGVTSAFTYRDREKMLEAFERNWKAENADNPERSKPIFDNWDIEYSTGDVDMDLLESESIRLDQWVTELYNDVSLTWKPLLFSIFDLLKNKKPLSDVEDKFYKRVAWLSMKKKGEFMLNAFFDTKLKDIKGLVEIDGKSAAQLQIKITSPEKDVIIGYVDYVVELQDGTIVILDCKTAASAYDDHKLLTSEQLKTYAAALEKHFDKIPEIGYLVLVKKLAAEKSCASCGHVRENSKLKNCTSCGEGKYEAVSYTAEVQLMHRAITEEEMDGQLEDYSHIADAVRNKVRYKNPENCFSFGRRCEFYDHCHKGKDLKKLSTIEPKKKWSK